MINCNQWLGSIGIATFLCMGVPASAAKQAPVTAFRLADFKIENPTFSPGSIADANTSETLDWEVITRQKGDYYQYYLSQVIYKKNDRTVWQVDLPDRIAKQVIESSYRQPIEVQNLHGFPFLMGTTISSNLVWIADGTGVLVIDKQRGEIVVDRASETSPEVFYVDGGMANIATPDRNCEIPVELGRFFTECGRYVVYFDRGHLEIWNRKGQLLAAQNYHSETDNLETKSPLEQHISMSSEQLTVEIYGWILNR
jgi:hypothetical protein